MNASSRRQAPIRHLIRGSRELAGNTAVVADDLQENIARGQSEYLSSLGVLLDVPAKRQGRFSSLSQENYALMFPAETNGSHDALTVLRQQLAVSQAQALR